MKTHPFHVMTKPIGPICNLDCSYCFYLEKEKMFPRDEQFRMSPEVLETYVRQYIESQDSPEVRFAWQGGEPTLLGIQFFRDAVALQQKYAGGKTIHNAFQTNGVLLDDEWCSFFTENRFLVGLSIDGPRELHDVYRVDKRRRPTFDRVMSGLEHLQKHKTDYNTLTVVHRKNSQHPLEVYRFLQEIGSQFLQFIPLVERHPTHEAKELGLDLGRPPAAGEEDSPTTVTSWSVLAEDYGEFLVQVFETWVRNDVGRTFVQLFDVALSAWMGVGSSLCYFAKTCGRAMAMEHDGSLFSCDHYVYPDYKLGNIMNQSLGAMVDSDAQRTFGNNKRDTLPAYCRGCDVRFACNGECPKHRFMKTPEGEAGLNYLCPAYKRIFGHMDPAMRVMAHCLRSGRPAAHVMEWVKDRDLRHAFATAKRNDPCPCGSGRRFKQCCASK